MTHRHGNGRIQHRTGGGRFRTSTLADLGIPNAELADGELACEQCGHVCRPIVKTFECICGWKQGAGFASFDERAKSWALTLSYDRNAQRTGRVKVDQWLQHLSGSTVESVEAAQACIERLVAIGFCTRDGDHYVLTGKG